jgi:hypothetical protein
MQPHDRQINEMIEATMGLAQTASSLELKVASCLYRMILLELTNLVDEKNGFKRSPIAAIAGEEPLLRVKSG